MKKTNQNFIISKAFSLVEILLVIVILGVISSVGYQNFSDAITSGNRSIINQQRVELQAALDAWIIDYSSKHGIQKTIQDYNVPFIPFDTSNPKRPSTGLPKRVIDIKKFSVHGTSLAILNRYRFELVAEFLDHRTRNHFSDNMLEIKEIKNGYSGNLDGSVKMKDGSRYYDLGTVSTKSARKVGSIFVFQHWRPDRSPKIIIQDVSSATGVVNHDY